MNSLIKPHTTILPLIFHSTPSTASPPTPPVRSHSLNYPAVDIVDIDYTLWLWWCLAPLLITFLLPLIIVILLYLTALILYIYKLHWKRLKETLESGDRWEAGRKAVGAIWDAHGWIWHGEGLPMVVKLVYLRSKQW